MSETLSFLYAFQSGSLYIVEAKRLDLPKSAPKNATYKWIYHNEITSVTELLGFQSMSSDGQKEYREFDKSSISFDDKIATYICADGEIITMQKISSQDLPKHIALALEPFIVDKQ